MFIYIVTFLLGILLDNIRVHRNVRRAFIVWLYIFLCFGYMTGSDWRAYELQYQFVDYYYLNVTYEKGFYALFYFVKKRNFALWVLHKNALLFLCKNHKEKLPRID